MKHSSKPTTLLFTLVLVGLVILTGCSGGLFGVSQPEPTPIPTVVEPGIVSAEGRIVPVRSATLGFPAGGQLDKLLAVEGQSVTQGDLLAKLGQREAMVAALSQAQLEQLAAQQALDELNDRVELARTQSWQALIQAKQALSDAQKALDDLDTTEFQDELDDLNITIQDKLDELNDARDELDRYKDLDPDNPTRKAAQEAFDDARKAHNDAIYARDAWRFRLDLAKAAVDTAEAAMNDALLTYDSYADGPDPDQLELAQARLDNAAAQAAAAQSALDALDLLAPYDATVIKVADVAPGENVLPGTSLVTLADLSAWVVETRDLTELDVVKVEVGQKVTVTPDAISDLELRGVVESIEQVFTERSGDILYTVRIRLEDTDPSLRWGMTVTVIFE